MDLSLSFPVLACVEHHGLITWHIQREDLKAVARELGENMSDEELQEMIREADKVPKTIQKER